MVSMELRNLEMAEWEELLPDSNFGVFHTPEALRVVDKHTTGELRLLGGFKGEQPIGLLPIVIKKRAGLRFVLSPPTKCGIRDLGPILMPTSPKKRKQEKVNRTFTDTVVKAVNADDPLTLFRMSCGPWYDDPRPYRWAGFDVKPSFTYQLDLSSTTPDEILHSFSKSARREIRDAEEADIIVRAQKSRARNVYTTVQNRYDEQGKGFRLSWEYMRDLVEALGDRAKVYVAESSEGEFLSGIVVLYSNDTAYFWKGGARNSYQNISVNTLLHWRIISDIITDPPIDSIARYDLYSANNERIARYKSKFGGELVPHYTIESRGLLMGATKKAYRLVFLNDRFLEFRSRLQTGVGSA